LQPRKARGNESETETITASMGPWLCSHGRQVPVEVLVVLFPASMGPWLCSHGRARNTVDRRASSSCFNGAVALQPRKVARVQRECDADTQLQWGRGFAATEGNADRAVAAALSDASMGPWLCSHGRIVGGSFVCGASGASMGPWLCSHGRGGSSMGYKRAGWLQWGRGFAATEGTDDIRRGVAAAKLQWGRGFAATEGR